jgi:hypothetical protein
MTTVRIEFSDQKAADLKAKAMTRGLSAEQYVREVVDRDLEQTATPLLAAPPGRHISDVIAEITSEVPIEVFETLPRDGASEHDHYLYGSPKKNQ